MLLTVTTHAAILSLQPFSAFLYILSLVH